MTNWIAVVDDDMTTLTVAGRILSNNNMRVSAMNSGKAFLSFIKDNKPDLVLVQTDMPEMDGITTVQKLRDYEGKKGLKAIPVIFLMTNDNEEIEKQGKELGVVDFIKKPFAPEVFLNVIWKNILSDKGVKCRNKAETGKVENIQPIDHTAVEMDEKQDLEHLNRTLKEKSDPNSALWVDNKAFASIYRFFARYIESYKVHACKVLFNFSEFRDISELKKSFDELMDDFGQILVGILRKSDVMVQSKPNQFLLLLPEVDEAHLESVLDRIERSWTESKYSDYVAIIYERELVSSDESVLDERKGS
ncbi:MAG: response regulator [Lachnospiraceae bacterium]|nr:response regulator [Lachnospiraceae bacterium]